MKPLGQYPVHIPHKEDRHPRLSKELLIRKKLRYLHLKDIPRWKRRKFLIEDEHVNWWESDEIDTVGNNKDERHKIKQQLHTCKLTREEHI